MRSNQGDTMTTFKACALVLLAGGLLFAPLTAEAASKKKAKAQAAAAERKESRAERPRHSAPSVDKAISLNILGALYGTLGLTYEQMLSRENSFTAGLDYAGRGIAGNSFTILGAHGSYRWWFEQPRAMSGFFAGPAAFIYNLTWSYDWYNVNNARIEKQSSGGFFFGAGAEGGYQYVFDNGLLLNGGANLGYLAGGINSAAGGPSLGFGGPYLGLLGSVGYAF